MAAIDELLYFSLLNVLDIGFSGIEHGYFAGIGVKTDDPVASFSKAQRQGKAHVTASNNCNF